MTYKELLIKIDELKPTFTINHASIARTFMIPLRATIQQWEKDNKVPDTYVNHILKQWKDSEQK